MTASATPSKRLVKNPKTVLVGLGELKVSGSREEVLVAGPLGSCVGLALYDPRLQVGGMVHCMLPLADVDPEKSAQRPTMFVDTGVVALLNELVALGSDPQDLIAKVAGGGLPLGRDDSFQIGPRNSDTVREVLWDNEIVINKESVGGSTVRTLSLYIKNGRTTVKYQGKEVDL